MRLKEAAVVMYAGVVFVSAVLRVGVQGGQSATESHALDMVLRAQKMYDLERGAKSDARTTMQRLSAAQATLQCARQLANDHTLERLSQVDVLRLSKALNRELAQLHSA